MVVGRLDDWSSLDQGRGSRGHMDCLSFLHRSGHMVDGKVSGTNTEAEGVSDVVDSLDDAVGVDIAVGAPGDAISRLDLLLDRVLITVAVAVLADVILSVVLGALGTSGTHRDGSSDNGSGHRCRRSYILNLLSRLGSRLGHLSPGVHEGLHRKSLDYRSVVEGEVLRLNGSSGMSPGVGHGVSLLGSGHFRGVHHSGHGSLGQVGGSHAEAGIVGDVLDSLEEAVTVDVPVGAAHHAISGLHLLPH